MSEENGGEDGRQDEAESPKRTLSEKRKQKLLGAATWHRDRRLIDAAGNLRTEMGTAAEPPAYGACHRENVIIIYHQIC